MRRRDTRNIWSTSGNVFESLPARERPSSALSSLREFTEFGIIFLRIGRSGSTGNIMEHGIPTPSLTLKPLSHTGGTYSRNGKIGYPRFPISEMHLGWFPDSVEFQSWKVNFKTAVCSKTADPHLTMHWIKEVETATSIDELVTSRSIFVEQIPPTTIRLMR